MLQVLRTVDKANGYCFGDLEERNLQAMMSAAVGADFQFGSYPYCSSGWWCFFYSMVLNNIFLNKFNFSTLGVEEKYVKASKKTLEEEVMDL